MSTSGTAPMHIPDGFPNQRLLHIPAAALAIGRLLPVVRDLHVVHIGHFPNTRYHHIDRPAGVAEAILIYCVKGGGWCTIGEKLWRVGSGQVLVVPPGEPHLYRADIENPWAIYWLHFAGERCADYLELLGVGGGRVPVLNVCDAGLLVSDFEKIYSCFSVGFGELALTSGSVALSQFLLDIRLHRQSEAVPGGDERIGLVVDYMQKNISRNLGLSDLARVIRVSPAHFCALFQATVGMAPIRFFTELRMRKACERLDSTQDTIGEIADTLGYPDALYFSRCFRRVIGCSPRDYRKRLVSEFCPYLY